MDNKYDYNKHYTIRDLCELLGIEYNKKNPQLSLNKIKYELQLEQISKQKYRIIKEFSPEEKAELRHYSQCKSLLEPTIYYLLSQVETGTGIKDDMKGLFEKFHITNKHYRYFSYDELTDKKYQILESMGIVTDATEYNMIFNHFVTDVNPILRRIVLDTLYKMVNESYISLNKSKVLVSIEKKFLGYDKEDNPKYDVMHVKKEMDNDDEIKYTTIRRDYMEKYKYNEWDKVPYPIKCDIESRTISDMGYHYQFTLYEILPNTEGLKRIVEYKNLVKPFEELEASVSEKLKKSKSKNLLNTGSEIKDICIDNLIKSKTQHGSN